MGRPKHTPFWKTSGQRFSDPCPGHFLFLLLSLIVSLFFICVVPASAEDALFRANPENTGVYDNGSIEPGNTELWRFAMGDWVDSSPAVANGIVYFGSNDKNLYAIGANSSYLTTVPATIPSTHIALPRTTIRQTIASTPTTSPASGKYADPTVALPVLAIIVTITLLAGGECILDRVKNKP